VLAEKIERLDAEAFHRSLDIRFSQESEPPLGYGIWEKLQHLMDAEQRVDKGMLIPANLQAILAEGSHFGTARSKAAVRDNLQMLWLAKFPSRQDAINIPVLEAATLRSAATAGLIVPPVRLVSLGVRTVMLIQ
jgi:serine/threonine-protein kinase HipA